MSRRPNAPDENTQHGRVADEVIAVLNEWLESARFPTHSRLPPEREIAQTLQLSRGKVRQALLQLETDGRIWRHVGRGTFVGCRPASIHSSPESLGRATTLSEILEARSAIEPVVARLAALRAEVHEVGMIKKYFTMAQKCTSWSEWEKWDDLFHRAVAEASGNGILISSVDQLLRIKTHPRWTLAKATTFDPALIQRYSDEHFALLNAITGRDSESADAAMKRHMLTLSLTVGPVVKMHNKPNRIGDDRCQPPFAADTKSMLSGPRRSPS